MIALLVVLTVGWVLLLVSNALADTEGYTGLYWAMLAAGSTFMVKSLKLQTEI